MVITVSAGIMSTEMGTVGTITTGSTETKVALTFISDSPRWYAHMIHCILIMNQFFSPRCLILVICYWEEKNRDRSERDRRDKDEM